LNPNASAPRVIIRHCDAYYSERIRAILLEGMRELGIVPRGRTLVKPNLVSAGDMFPHAHTRPEFGEGLLLALQDIGAALRPRGYLVFETRRPGRRAWEEWAAETGPVRREVAGRGLVERRLEVTAVDLPFVSFRNTYTFRADGTVITSDSTLRFRERDEVESSLAAQGYRVLDVRDAPDRPGREFVFISERTT